MRPPVLIIGAHRSGTSATAHALQIMGLQIGQRLDSHYESRELQRLHDDYLHEVGASWHDPGTFLDSIRTDEGMRQCVEYLQGNADRDFANIFGYRKNPIGLCKLLRLKVGAAWGWKEPRTTLFAPAWLQIFPQAGIIHVVRDPMAAALSIQRRELKFQSAGDPATGSLADLEYCLRLVRTYVAAGERLSSRDQYVRVRFEEIQADPVRLLAQTATLCGLKFSSSQAKRAAETIRPSAQANHSGRTD